ncbi:MAG: bifunctional DNA-formamidopyrimidine glycosylase/DNA-(apurinic or apyrimidinic site) lyase, partial [Gemmatimonadetes bacterium]|nr:bifunctional DNA-formamidopyrimidine glycosylase/DNA-(apurinic or apyrimidinic site) lyase [Gemmatimonadota bacterium]
MFDASTGGFYTLPMPELPEVETVRSAMECHLLGRPITRVRVSTKRLREPLPRAALRALVGDCFVAARRRAKFLLLDLQSGRTLLVHLGMSGNLLLRTWGTKHDHVGFEFADRGAVVFNDPRRFGLVLMLDGGEEYTCRYLQNLGPEPLSRAFNARYLQAQCQRRKSPIKNLIMDSSTVVGVGNIYASEALFRARIHPATPAAAIEPPRLALLAKEIKKVLRVAIDQGGTTISDYQGSG